MGSLSRLALQFHRSPKDTALSAGRTSYWAKTGLFVGATFTLAALFVPPFLHQLSRWRNIRPEIALPADGWSVLYQNDSNPDSTPGALWTSRARRGDEGHRAAMNARRGQSTWMGLEIPIEKLEQASRLKANQLVLGWLGGSYRVWLDGVLYAEGYWSSAEPIILAVPVQRLAEHNPLRVSLWFQDTAGQAQADYFDPLFGEGLASHEQARDLVSFASFWWSTRPFALLVANVMIAALFFLLWNSAREKIEYFYMAFFALIGAFYQVRMMDIFMDSVSADHRYLMETVLRLYEGSFGMFLGLSFSRSRAAFFKWGVPAALLLPFSAILFLPDPASKKAFGPMLDLAIVPILVAFGAVSCLLQAAHLWSVRSHSSFLPTRIRRLALFGGGLLLLASFYVMDGLWPFSTVGSTIHFRVGHLIVALLLSAVAIQDYREHRRLIEKTPISPYHRRPALPESIHGAMLAIDLRNSEQLFRLGAMTGESGMFVEECLSHLWTAVSAHGGVILGTDGDGLRAFFDLATCRFPVVSAIRACQEISSKLAFLKTKLQSDAQNLGVETEIRLGFRAAVTVGAIRPIWQEMGNMRQAAWNEAGNTLPFVESARLMEIERQLGSTPSDCLLVMMETSAETVQNHLDVNRSGKWRLRGQMATGKHGVQYQIAAYDAGKRKLPAEDSEFLARAA